ncbi:hypothetical protein T484DRAFT_1920279 [Baffinella frigidus]|nr:hypothetical protein T484DRAFT_1920279 [Cryptophyta sp. CCMP2293]
MKRGSPWGLEERPAGSLAETPTEEKEDPEKENPEDEDPESEDQTAKPLLRQEAGPSAGAAMGTLYTLSVVTCFMLVGPGLMIVNKEILSTVDFPYPLLVSSMGLVFAAVTTHSMQALGYLKLDYRDVVTKNFWVTKCLPVGVCHAATLAFGNAQYLHSGMALIQFMKSFTPIVTAVITYFLLNRRESRQSSSALLVLCIGTTLAAGGKGGELSTIGLGLALSSSITEAIRLVMTDFLLSGIKMQVLESLYYLSPAGGACLFLVGCVLEGPTLLAKGHVTKPLDFPLTFLAAASMGLGVQLLTSHVIKATSATSLKDTEQSFLEVQVARASEHPCSTLPSHVRASG